jgi:hypothetical protein
MKKADDSSTNFAALHNSLRRDRNQHYMSISAREFKGLSITCEGLSAYRWLTVKYLIHILVSSYSIFLALELSVWIQKHDEKRITIAGPDIVLLHF